MGKDNNKVDSGSRLTSGQKEIIITVVVLVVSIIVGFFIGKFLFEVLH